MAPTILSTVAVAATAAPGFGQAIDLVTLADVKLELDITDTAGDAWLRKVITRASQSVADHCNRIFQVQVYEDRIWPYIDPYPWQSPTRTRPLQLQGFPVAAAPSPSGTAPPQAPVLSSVAGGSLPAQSWFVRITYMTATGETAGSMAACLPLAAGQLLSVASPSPDPLGRATAWTVYAGTAPGLERRQNAVPMALGTAWTMPVSGPVALAGLPPYVLAVENFERRPLPLVEGLDFAVKPNAGQLTRLSGSGIETSWSMAPILVRYPAGFAALPASVEDAVLQIVKTRWFARGRDPMIRSQNAAGIYATQYWFGNGPGTDAAFPPDIAEKLNPYRVPVTA